MKIYMFNNKIMSFNDVWFKEPYPPTSVAIGTQIWKTNNLAIDDGGDGIIVANDQYYYTWNAAMRVAASVQGWHLPSLSEWSTLFTYCGAEDPSQPSDIVRSLASTSGWTNGIQGTDDYGLNLTPGGYYSLNGSPLEVGTSFRLWTSDTISIVNYAWYFYGTTDNSAYIDMESIMDSPHYQVRLIKD